MNTRSRRKTKVLAVLLAATAMAFAGASTASAATGTVHYCIRCTINSKTNAASPSNLKMYLNYVHRLSGPTTSGIQAFAYKTNWNYYKVCDSGVTNAREVTCSASGTVGATSYARNHGAGNYGFNAHVNYIL